MKSICTLFKQMEMILLLNFIHKSFSHIEIFKIYFLKQRY